jgi:hypothetical protein
MDARGVRLQGHVLQPIRGAKTIRVHDGELGPLTAFRRSSMRLF